MDQKRLRALEALCIQEESPWCTAACPVHVDVRALTKAIADGDLVAAYGSLAKAMVFPRIIGHICNHPCELRCKRTEIDQPVAIHSLERYCVQNTKVDTKRRPIRKNGSRAAVLGAGLCGLSAAVELAQKGYAVSLYETAESLGAELLDIPEDLLPEAVLQDELRILEALNIEIHCCWPAATRQSIMDLKADADAVFIARGGYAGTDLPPIDSLILATAVPGVFAQEPSLGVGQYIENVAQGKRAAISIDRYVQKVSLVAGREKEGPFETRLYTNISAVPASPAIEPRDAAAGYDAEEARSEARRCIQCECLECVKACEYLKAFGSYPRRYLREIYNNEAIVMGPRLANNLINSCSLCGLCQEVCPNGLNMGAVIKEARQGMVLRGKMPPSPHDFPIEDMNFSNSSHFAMLRHAPGSDCSQFIFYPGCQLCATMPRYVELAYEYLREALPDVGLALGCCGAPADWVGQQENFTAAQKRLLSELKSFGNPTLIVACSSCHDIFRRHFPDLKTISLWEIYDEHGLPTEQLLGLAGPIAIHDACTSRHEDPHQQAVRNIIARLGLQPEELPYSRDKTTCCGFGGLMTFANKEVVTQVIDRRIKESEHPYLVYCAMCKDRFSWRHKETFHLLDLIYGGIFPPGQKGLNTTEKVGFSDKRENRARLKERLLGQLWGEQMPGYEERCDYSLQFQDEARTKMEERLILKDDILKVIHHAETTNSKFRDKDTGHYLAYYQPRAVTYWVEYSGDGDVFEIHNVYSHRMEIGEGRTDEES